MSQAITTLIFDLGGVLIDWNPRHLYRKLLDDEAAIDDFLDRICTSDWNEQQDAGRSLEAATKSKVEEFPEKKELIEAYYGRWSEMLGGPIAGTVALLEELRRQQNYKLLALTNWSDETFPVAWERYSFLRYFEDILVSGREGLKKPDPAIYRLLLERNGLDPQGALFIDDNARNVAAAKKMGIKTIHFTSSGDFKNALEEKGLLE